MPEGRRPAGCRPLARVGVYRGRYLSDSHRVSGIREEAGEVTHITEVVRRVARPPDPSACAVAWVAMSATSAICTTSIAFGGAGLSEGYPSGFAQPRRQP